MTAKESAHKSHGTDAVVHTVFWDIQPDAILVERVLVRIEPLQVTATLGRLGQVLVHGRILLMTKDDALTGATFSAAFTTL